MIPITVSYDQDVDALSVDLFPGAARARTVQVARGILLHFDRAEQPIEVEVLGASAYCPRELLKRLTAPRPR